MSIFNYYEVSYVELSTFLSVARTLNMTLSANELNISQPAVSKRINRLEQHYGITLFHRSSSGLSLTPAGSAFYQEILLSCEHLESAFVKAASIQSLPIQILTIGYDGFFDIPILFDIVNRFHSRYHDVEIRIYDYKQEDCSDLLSGTADILISPNSFFANIVDYVNYEVIDSFPFSIFVSKNNPLAQSDSLTIADLAGVPLIVPYMNADSPYTNAVRNMCKKHGFSPRFEQLVTRDCLCFELLAKNGVSISSPRYWNKLDKRTRDFYFENMRIYPIYEESFPLSFVWMANNSDRNIKRFLKIYHEVISEGDNLKILKEVYL